MMKKMLAILIIFLMSFSVNAQELDSSTDEESVNVGITPDSPLYGLENAFKRISLAFTLNKEKKIKKELRFAKERLREVRLMVERGEIAGAERAKRRHGELLSRVRDRMGDLDENSEDDLDLNVELETEIEEQEFEIEDIRTRIDIRGELSDEQKRRLHNFLEDLRNGNDEVKIKIDSKKERLKIELEKKGVTREDIERRIEEKREGQFDQAFENRLNHVKREIEKSKRFMREKDRESDDRIERLSEAEELLNDARETFRAGEFEETKRLLNKSLRLAVSVRGEGVLRDDVMKDEAKERMKQKHEERKDDFEDKDRVVRTGVKKVARGLDELEDKRMDRVKDLIRAKRDLDEKVDEEKQDIDSSNDGNDEKREDNLGK